MLNKVSCPRHAHTCTKKKTLQALSYCFRTVGISKDCLWYVTEKLKEGATHALLRQTLNGEKKWKNKENALPPLSVKKGPCTQLLLNVGVPKILADRKFPILRRVLQSCSRLNGVIVFLLTLIAFLHPCSLSFTLSFSLTEYCIDSLEQGYADLMLRTWRQALDTVCLMGYNYMLINVNK